MFRSIMTVLVLGITMPAAAHAQVSKGYAPPGNAAIAESTEMIPGAGPVGRPAVPSRPSVPLLSSAQRASLERLGTEGKALANAVDTSSPARWRRMPGAAQALGDTGTPSAGEWLRAIGDGGGEGAKGLVFALLLIGSLVGAVVHTLQRWWAPR